MAINGKFTLLLIILILLTSCEKPADPQMEYTLGTMCTVNLYEGGTRELYSRVFTRIREIDRTMTAYPGEFQYLTDSGELYRSAVDTLASGVVAINEQAGIAPVKVRADLIELLEKARHYAAVSDGAFDPTVGPLVQLWSIGTDSQRVPGKEEIAQALELINWRDIVIDRDAGLVFLQRKGMALDLGAIAKGYAGDEAARIAREGKVQRAVIDLGGNIVTLGSRQHKKGKEALPWRIGIQNPESARGAYIGVVTVFDASVVTSGVYERFFEIEEKHYHHLFSTQDGYPVENGLLSVTIVAANSTDADALSTTIFTMGYEKGKALIDSIPDAEAIFVFSDHNVQITDGLAGNFTLTDTEYTLLP